jgi:hypothetical protein
MRTTGPEYLQTISLAARSTDYQLQNGLPNDYGYVGLWLDVSFRLVIGVHATAAPFFLSSLTFLERITVQGNLAGRGNIILFDMPGWMAWRYGTIMKSVTPYVDPDNIVVAAGAIGTYDIRFQIPVYFIASANPGGRFSSLLPAYRFANPLTLTIRTGAAAAAIGNVDTGTTYVYTAYGSGAGSPGVDVSRIVVKQGPGSMKGSQILCTKTVQGPFVLTATVTDGQIGRLNTGNLIGRIYLLTGLTDTTTPTVLASTSNAMLTRLRLKQNQQLIRDEIFQALHRYTPFALSLPEFSNQGMSAQGPAGQTGAFATGETIGEALVDFVPDGTLDDALNTVGWQAAGANLYLNGDVTGVANQVVHVMTEEYSRVPGA